MDTFTQELIGVRTRIISSQNKSAIGAEGKIIDETRNTITIETKNGRKKFIKKQHTFEINGEEVPGTMLAGRSDERLKRWTRTGK